MSVEWWSVVDKAHWPVFPSPELPVVCNCACSRCLSGDCCLISRPYEWTVPTGTATGTGFVVSPHEHSWQAVGLDKGDVIQSCPCGNVRRVPVP